MDQLILEAARFARQAHANQTRKFTNQPYVAHVARVAGRVAAHPDVTAEDVAAAFLHDVVEDTSYTLADLDSTFGRNVSTAVDWLTKRPNEGLAAYQRLANAPDQVKLIKLVDRIDNLSDWAAAPADFLDHYVDDTKTLVGFVGNAHPTLQAELASLVAKIEARLQIK